MYKELWPRKHKTPLLTCRALAQARKRMKDLVNRVEAPEPRALVTEQLIKYDIYKRPVVSKAHRQGRQSAEEWGQVAPFLSFALDVVAQSPQCFSMPQPKASLYTASSGWRPLCESDPPMLLILIVSLVLYPPSRLAHFCCRARQQGMPGEVRWVWQHEIAVPDNRARARRCVLFGGSNTLVTALSGSSRPSNKKK